MSTLRNSPTSNTVLRVEARKSFQLGLFIKDHLGMSLDITGVTLRMVLRKHAPATSDADAGNLLVNGTGVLVQPGAGYAVFGLQASELDLEPGDYDYSITMIANGYSSVIVAGTLEIEPNTEYSSIASTYAVGQSTTQLMVELREQAAISVYAGYVLAPGTQSFRDADAAKLASIQTGAQVNVPADWNATAAQPGYILNKPTLQIPAGGAPSEVLAKLSSTDRDVGWAQPANGGSGGNLNGTGVGANRAPVANGANSWGWTLIPITVNGYTGFVVLTLDDIANTATRLAMTPAERAKLAYFSTIPNYSDLAGKPTLGTAAAQDTTAFLPAAGIDAVKIITGILNNARVPRVNDLRGTSRGTAAPSGGSDGDIYRQYT